MLFLKSDMVNDIPNQSLADTVLAGKLTLLPALPRVSGKDFSSLFLIQFAMRAFITFKTRRIGKIMASRFNHILHVVLMCSHQQMGWVYASGIVFYWTLVANAHSFWNRAILHYPRGNMSANGTMGRDAPLKFTVSVTLGCASPQPASVRAGRFINFFPKAFLESCRPSLLFKKLRVNFDLHNVSRLALCHVPGSPERGDIFIIGNNQGIAT